MMLLFPDRNGKQRERQANPATDKKAFAIAKAIIKGQEKTAGWLNRKFSALPHYARVICLLLFCLVLGGASGWILAQAVLPGPDKSAPVAPPTLPQKQYRQELQHLPDSLGHQNEQHYEPLLK